MDEFNGDQDQPDNERPFEHALTGWIRHPFVGFNDAPLQAFGFWPMLS